MTRRSLPVFLSLLLLGPLLAAPGARGQDLPLAASQDEEPPAAKSSNGRNDRRSDGRIPVTRSDGSTGLTRPPDAKEIKKLVSYMRAGMNRADNADKQRQTRRVNPYRRVIKNRK
jgi:hypothetical protein